MLRLGHALMGTILSWGFHSVSLGQRSRDAAPEYDDFPYSQPKGCCLFYIHSLASAVAAEIICHILSLLALRDAFMKDNTACESFARQLSL